MNKHLFVCIANNSGSSIVYHMLDSSNNTVLLTDEKLSFQEGQHLVSNLMPQPNQFGIPCVQGMHPENFRDSTKYNWDEIKKRWYKVWKRHPKYSSTSVLVEKSTTNPLRADLLYKQFPNSYFIIAVRNPYAIVEGIRRRYNYDIKDSTLHSANILRYNAHWRYLIPHEYKISIRYEDICANPHEFKKKLVKMLPELSDLNVSSIKPTYKNINHYPVNRLVNFNEKQIANLNSNDIKQINQVLKDYAYEMAIWGYKFL